MNVHITSITICLCLQVMPILAAAPIDYKEEIHHPTDLLIMFNLINIAPEYIFYKPRDP